MCLQPDVYIAHAGQFSLAVHNISNDQEIRTGTQSSASKPSNPHIQMSLNAAEPFLSVSEKPSLPSPRSRKPSRLVAALAGACLVACAGGAALYFKQRSLRGAPSHELDEVDLDTTWRAIPVISVEDVQAAANAAVVEGDRMCVKTAPPPFLSLWGVRLLLSSPAFLSTARHPTPAGPSLRLETGGGAARREQQILSTARAGAMSSAHLYQQWRLTRGRSSLNSFCRRGIAFMMARCLLQGQRTRFPILLRTCRQLTVM